MRVVYKNACFLPQPPPHPGPKIQTRELPDGTTTEEFQDWTVVFGFANAKRSKNLTKVKGICRDALEQDRNGTYFYEKLVDAAAQRHKKNLFDASYYWLQYQMPDTEFTINVEIDNPAEARSLYALPDPSRSAAL